VTCGFVDRVSGPERVAQPSFGAVPRQDPRHWRSSRQVCTSYRHPEERPPDFSPRSFLRVLCVPMRGAAPHPGPTQRAAVRLSSAGRHEGPPENPDRVKTKPVRGRLRRVPTRPRTPGGNEPAQPRRAPPGQRRITRKCLDVQAPASPG
jgi:hypothetical protein